MKIIFKHSKKCSISARAKHELERFLKKNPLECEIVDVIEDRKRSNEIAETYNIDHESPQIIVLDEDNHVRWHASHYEITEDRIKQAIF